MINPRPLNPITDDDVAAFREDGTICLRGMFDRAWLDLLAAGIEKARKAPGPWAQDHTVPGEATGFFSDLAMWRRIPEFRGFVLNSPSAEIAGRLMGSAHVNLLHDAMWVKEPGTSRRTPWHHDQPFYCADGEQSCVVWVPIDPVPREITLETIAGSHRWDRSFKLERINGGYYDGSGTDGYRDIPGIEDNRGAYRIVGWALEPGDCLVLHGRTFHGAAGNATARPRRAVSNVWVGDDAVYIKRPHEMQPDFTDTGLVAGDPIDRSPVFPRCWTRPAEV